MLYRGSIQVICALALLGACGGGKGGSTDTSASSSGPTGDPAGDDPTGDDPTGTDPTQTTEADGSGSGTAEPTGGDPTGDAESHRICDLYLNCLAVIAPTELPDAQQGFGPNGTCWQGDAGSAQQCISACQDGLETWHEYDPSEPLCWLCQAPTDCPEGQMCEGGECEAAPVVGCGDGKIGADEVCDGNPGCDADCLGPAECSPYTLAGCKAGEVCLYKPGSDPSCASGDAGLPELDEACDPNVNEQCAEGLICAPSNLSPTCPTSGCCVALCDRTSGEGCAGDHSCTPNLGGVSPPGLDYIGFCF